MAIATLSALTWVTAAVAAAGALLLTVVDRPVRDAEFLAGTMTIVENAGAAAVEPAPSPADPRR